VTIDEARERLSHAILWAQARAAAETVPGLARFLRGKAHGLRLALEMLEEPEAGEKADSGSENPA